MRPTDRFVCDEKRLPPSATRIRPVIGPLVEARASALQSAHSQRRQVNENRAAEARAGVPRVATSIFNRYGGFANVSKIVMEFYDLVLDSEIAGDYFVDVDMPTLVDHQTKFIASIMGGPASYSNEALERIHAHLDITKEAFDEIVSLLRMTLEDFELDPADVDQVIDGIRARERYIVNA